MQVNNQKRQKTFAFFVFLVSIILLFNALPLFLSSINHIPVKRAINQLVKKETLSPKKLDSLIEKSKLSHRIWNNAQYWHDLHLLLIHKSQAVSYFTQQGQQLLFEAQQANQQSLKFVSRKFSIMV